jgi:pimeloyl-ACP methyl ester carboxylesterase
LRAPHTTRALFVAAVLVAAAIGAVLIGHRLTKLPRFLYLYSPLSPDDYSALAAKPGWHAQVTTTSDGLTLRGLERAPDDPAAHPATPWVLFFDGNSRTILADAERFLDALRAERPWGAAAWAYRGFDGNPGTPAAGALAEDGWQSYTQLMGRWHLPARSVHIVAFSIGTSVAVALAARARGETAIASLTLISPLTALEMMHPGHLDDTDRFETTPSLARLAGPVLIVHSRDDHTLPVDGARDIARRLGERARYVEMSGVDHGDMLASPEVIAAVRAFIVQGK